jgi:Cdc6-like AAA superfamily ATPase
VEVSQIRDLINLNDISENIWKEEHSKIMQSLSHTNFWGKQVDLFRRAQNGSGRWILEDESFNSWLTEHPRIFWCKGEAGAGKTFLSAIIINYLSFSMKNENIGIAWLYVDYRERDSHTLENFYANILLQLFKQTGGVSKSMMKSLGSKREEAKPSAGEYKSWLQEEVQKFDRTFIIIDALDEMRTEELCKQLIDELQSLIPRIHLLVTSRLEMRLPIMNDDLIEIEIRPRKGDVILFIESRLQDSPLLWDHISKNPPLRDLTMDMLTKANNRMLVKTSSPKAMRLILV